MNTTHFSGVWTAIATPFLENGSIDWPAFEKHLAQQASGGVNGIVISGTTGESPTLTVQEKISLVRKARALLPGTIRIMAGSGGNNTAQSVELSKLCVDAGADSLLIVTPPYNKPSPAGLKLHFQTIADAVDVPLCLYHVPGRTGQSLSAGIIASLTSINRVLAVKEASGDLALYGRVVCQSKADVLSGDDPTYLASLAVGGQGVIKYFPRRHGAINNGLQKSEKRPRPNHSQNSVAVDRCVILRVKSWAVKGCAKYIWSGQKLASSPAGACD
jgi:4-hydroxy-tetrahydrodipicolinate synthase